VNDAEIYAELRMDLMRYATALVGVSDAGDVVSSVVTRVMAKDGLVGLDEPKAYLMRSILNEVRMRHRSRSRETRAVLALKADAPQQRHEDHIDHVLDLIMDLPPRQRAAVFLAYYEQYSPTEIAELMRCRPGTVRRYLHLARAKLKEVING
jgi:RNA polymerase sigma factor (sigma-70 family)